VISQAYLEYSFIVKPLSLGNEILIAELAYVGFESFVEDHQGLKAYIQKKEWNKNILEEIQILDSNEFKITYSKKEIEQVNWNAAWEKKFSPN
jgi:ribosomal protein L11 methyltransferase